MQVNISVIIPCYNQAQYLEECLQSVINQDYESWECIIVNDGSNDNTEQIAKQWERKDERFKYVFKENGGLSSARNKGIEKAIGEFILPLDADDKIEKNYLQLAIEEFKKEPNLKVVYCKAEKFGKESGRLNLKPFSLKNLAVENMIFCTALFRKEEWEKVGGYDVNMVHGLEDWEFWISILKNGGQVTCLDKVLFYYRIKTNSMLKSIDDAKYRRSCEYINIKHADFYVKELGSFVYAQSQLNVMKQQMNDKLKSKKFVLNAFFKVFFGFSIFKRFDN